MCTQNLSLGNDDFQVMKVDEDNIQMSRFIEKTLGTFENGRAFYEFTGEEDLIYYKEVVKVQKGKLKVILLISF